MSKRSIEIDVTKGILTMVMVMSHSVQFFYNGTSPVLKKIEALLNLTGFSAFFFCFGYAVWTAYLQKAKIPWPSVLKTSLKCYVVFVISVVAFLILVKDQALSFTLVAKVVFLRLITGYSEFLMAFSLVTIIACLFPKAVAAATSDLKKLSAATILLLGFTFLPRWIDIDPVIGLIVGGGGYAYFPVVQYAPLFLLGVYFARSGRTFEWKYILLSVLGCVIFLLQKDYISGYVRHFPPSAAWILLSAGMTYLCYFFSSMLCKYSSEPIKRYFVHVGQNVLSYLLLSNIALFASRALGVAWTYSFFGVTMIFIALMSSIFFFHYISTPLRQSNNTIIVKE